MLAIVEVAPSVVEATATQRARTENAVRAGAPGMAATPEQRRRWKDYLNEKWPELARVVDVSLHKLLMSRKGLQIARLEGYLRNAT